MIRGVANQPIGCNLRKLADGTPYVGNVTVYVKGDLTPQIQGTVGGGVVVSNAQGYAEYLPSAAETDFQHIAFTFDAATALGDTVQVYTVTPAEVQALATATGLASVAASVIVTEALYEIRVARAGDAVEPDLMDFGIGKLNRLLDRWNADPRARYTVGFTSFTPTPNHQPHSIGPNGADWTVTQRPRAITAANLILNSVTPNVRIPLGIKDQAWWRRVSVQGLATSLPRDLYYSPDFPNGSIYLWPIPTSTYAIELQLDGLFGMLTATDTFWMPFGYRDAITLTLAEELAPGCGQLVAPSTSASANQARALIFSNNDDEPRLTTDAGLRGGDGHLSGFNWATRSWSD